MPFGFGLKHCKDDAERDSMKRHLLIIGGVVVGVAIICLILIFTNVDWSGGKKAGMSILTGVGTFAALGIAFAGHDLAMSKMGICTEEAASTF